MPPRDITPEATYAVADRNAPGIAEAMRYHSLSITPRGMLSRAASVLRGKTLIVNLPGSPKAVKENLEYILPSLEHGVRIAAGLDGEWRPQISLFHRRGVAFGAGRENKKYNKSIPTVRSKTMKTMISRRGLPVRCRHRIRICCSDRLRRLLQQHCIFHRILRCRLL